MSEATVVDTIQRHGHHLFSGSKRFLMVSNNIITNQPLRLSLIIMNCQRCISTREMSMLMLQRKVFL